MTYRVTAAGVKVEQGTDVEYSRLVHDCEACPQNLHRAWWGNGEGGLVGTSSWGAPPMI